MIDYSQPRPGVITLALLDRATCETIIGLCNEQDEAYGELALRET